MAGKLRLGVNIDHVATVRNARGGQTPDPVRAAQLAHRAGADGITAHLREDRRHIRDADIARIIAEVDLPLNFEMAATKEMIDLVLKEKPHAACLVPEKREEVTTEGGLDVAGLHNQLKSPIQEMSDAGSRVSLFIEADERQIEAAKSLGAPVVELHTGTYCEAHEEGDQAEIDRQLLRLIQGAQKCAALGIECHMGHGLSFETVKPVAAIMEVMELNIGHFLIGEAIFLGLEGAIIEMRRLMDEARS